MTKGIPLDIDAAFGHLTFLGTRTPDTNESEGEVFAARLAAYRNGGVFVSHFGGSSEWERHPSGDEIVIVLEGETDLFLFEGGQEVKHTITQGQLFVVPEDTWHRFETASVKILTVTPRPTDHRTERPE